MRFADAMNWLSEQDEETQGVPLVYRAAINGLARDIVGTPSDEPAVVETTTTPIRFSYSERVYAIRRSTLAAVGILEPSEGDWITETINGEQMMFVVSARGDEPCWQWAEAEKLTYLVYTKVK